LYHFSNFKTDIFTVNNIFVAKIAYIKKIFRIFTVRFILTILNIVLDTELPKTGKRINRWSIQQNLETETIKSAIYT